MVHQWLLIDLICVAVSRDLSLRIIYEWLDSYLPVRARTKRSYNIDPKYVPHTRKEPIDTVFL